LKYNAEDRPMFTRGESREIGLIMAGQWGVVA
jgi:hypothetical protein